MTTDNHDNAFEARARELLACGGIDPGHAYAFMGELIVIPYASGIRAIITALR